MLSHPWLQKSITESLQEAIDLLRGMSTGQQKFSNVNMLFLVGGYNYSSPVSHWEYMIPEWNEIASAAMMMPASSATAIAACTMQCRASALHQVYMDKAAYRWSGFIKFLGG